MSAPAKDDEDKYVQLGLRFEVLDEVEVVRKAAARSGMSPTTFCRYWPLIAAGEAALAAELLLETERQKTKPSTSGPQMNWRLPPYERDLVSAAADAAGMKREKFLRVVLLAAAGDRTVRREHAERVAHFERLDAARAAVR